MATGKKLAPLSGRYASAAKAPVLHAQSSYHAMKDNRKHAARVASLQAMMIDDSKRGQPESIFRRERWWLQAAGSWIERKALPLSNYWPIMDVADYLKRHGLKRKSTSSVGETLVITLADNSAIFLYNGQLLRHESASRDAVFYDSSHSESLNPGQTHFWARTGKVASTKK